MDCDEAAVEGFRCLCISVWISLCLSLCPPHRQVCVYMCVYVCVYVYIFHTHRPSRETERENGCKEARIGRQLLRRTQRPVQSRACHEPLEHGINTHISIYT